MDESADGGNKKKIVVTVAILLAVVLVVGGAAAFAKRGNPDAAATTTAVVKTATPTTTPSTSTTDSAAADPNATTSNSAATTYKNGTYTTEASYGSPGGTQKIGVSITIAGDIVTDSTVTAEATDGEAQNYQQDFISAYKQLVVGKKIDTISLSRVSGSSLTSNGFNSALQAIEAQAKA
jgi:flagellar basal body-associated protein FliL